MTGDSARVVDDLRALREDLLILVVRKHVARVQPAVCGVARRREGTWLGRRASRLNFYLGGVEDGDLLERFGEDLQCLRHGHVRDDEFPESCYRCFRPWKSRWDRRAT